MRYDEIDILDALKECRIKNQVGFIGILPSFTFDKISKSIVNYHIGPKEGKYDLEVYDTEIIDLEEDLINFLKGLELNKADILVFCINQEFIPKENQIRIKVLSFG